jgi:hypothetical protein
MIVKKYQSSTVAEEQTRAPSFVFVSALPNACAGTASASAAGI